MPSRSTAEQSSVIVAPSAIADWRAAFKRSAAKTCGVVVLALLCAFLAAVACGQWSFYPVMPALVCWWGYAPYAALMLLPAAAAVAERIRWRGLE